MPTQRVLLVCSQRLFGESMEMVLRRATGIEVIGPWDLDDTVCSRIPEADPHVVVIAEEDPNNEKSVYLAATIMEQYPDLSVICMGLAENVFRVFSTKTLPARSTDLLEAILGL